MENLISAWSGITPAHRAERPMVSAPTSTLKKTSLNSADFPVPLAAATLIFCCALSRKTDDSKFSAARKLSLLTTSLPQLPSVNASRLSLIPASRKKRHHQFLPLRRRRREHDSHAKNQPGR